ncbi:NIPSNAP family protein [Dyella mobilis]|uniref:NIPSNAP family protein n=1 Tax=Dyella mobilis TaxID=1849582 RepID=A0ABS2KHV6_9GAMM|nr:NIPSNAP family protein [Dyella mobilis]MBM7130640.1 NIPSNAP family protein [Dyella mobilis]GLQ97267.1 NIPSNAP family containing protein [Dyella mobilis]
MTSPASPSASHDDNTECAVIELRQYTLHPGKRDVLIDVFEREFVESQEVLGMRLLGQFRNLDNPDTFVWLRGFKDMPSRLEGLTGFYTGPVWMANRNTANDTMIDSDNVLLLKPAWNGSGLVHRPLGRAPVGSQAQPPGLIDVTVFALKAAADQPLLDFCKQEMTGVLENAGAHDIAWYVTEDAPNNFPGLPVRTGEHVLVGIAVFRDTQHYGAFIESGAWHQRVAPTLDAWLRDGTQSMRLVPTPRSTLHD